MKSKILLVLVPLVIILAGGGIFLTTIAKSSQNPTDGATPVPTAKPKVNLIDIKDRPYISLEPLTARNELQLTVHNLPKKAEEMEVLLEYDRNKGVLDAVLKNYSLTNIPSINKIFLGSKSTGGHITYHDDVVGGSLTLTFTSDDEPYSLEVPWRYDDTQPRYSELATQDLKFQLVLDEPFRTPKILIMQSPGLPIPADGEVLAGPYLVRGVGVLPKINGQLTIRLIQAEPNAKLLIFNGQSWQAVDSVITDRALTARVPLAEAYLVTK